MRRWTLRPSRVSSVGSFLAGISDLVVSELCLLSQSTQRDALIRTRGRPGCSRKPSAVVCDPFSLHLSQFSSQSLLAIEDVHWLEEFTLAILERIQDGRDEEEQKAFLYRLFGFTLRTSRNLKLVQKMLPAMLNTSQEEPEEREGIAKALAVVSLEHLTVVLDELEVYGTKLTDRDTSSILKLAQVTASWECSQHSAQGLRAPLTTAPALL
ncbi:uncharacterized protein LOC128588744 [Nycticebus coucang]|uniref:uncharacterized protein LOC128588744 n=1 Tax=Nycticebus coucang TaxID=9470 RepID=UPI00234E03F8|nr:uncharacterized protein LOC128588744 [Nycticebus coucang]